MSNIPRNVVLNSLCFLDDISDSLQIRYKRHQEMKKFSDPRRRAIYSKVELTSTQKKEIDDVYYGCYGEKIPYIWHRHYTAFTGVFDPLYFPELLYIPEFERFSNIYTDFVKVFTDKNVLPYVAKMAGIKMPETIISSTRGLVRDLDNNILNDEQVLSWLSNAGELFVKPSINTGSGVGCRLIQMDGGKDQLTGNTALSVLNNLGNDYVIQRRIICSKDIENLHQNSCNTFRIVTYRWKKSIKCMPVIMRIGRNNNIIDNAHAGGIFIGVESDGTLKNTAFTEFKEVFSQHPDSGIVFENYHINGFRQVLDSAKKMHSLLPQLGVVNWDFTIDRSGNPILIEANTRGGGIWVLEMAHGKGPFGNNTKDVLRWMREMKRRKLSQRGEIAFGNY